MFVGSRKIHNLSKKQTMFVGESVEWKGGRWIWCWEWGTLSGFDDFGCEIWGGKKRWKLQQKEIMRELDCCRKWYLCELKQYPAVAPTSLRKIRYTVILLIRGMLGMSCKIQKNKTNSAIFFTIQLAKKWSPYNSGFKWLSQSYDCKETLVGSLHDKKLVEAVLLYSSSNIFP